MELRDLPKEFEGGFKIDYSKIKKAVMQCELDKNSSECKRMLKDLKIEVIE